MRKRIIGCLLGVASLAVIAAPVAAAGPGGYKIVNRWKIGGEGGWDYLSVDAGARRLYFGRGNRVQALDLDTGKIAGEVADTPGIHGVALVPDAGRAFTSNGRDSTVTIFDLKSLATIAKVRLDAQNPDAILYEPSSKQVFTFNGRSRNATALDEAAGKVVGTLDLDGRPEFAVADGQGNVFVNIEDSSAVVRFDAKSLKVTGRWSIAPGDGPSGLAIDAAHHRLFSVCSNSKMMVLDAVSGKVVAEVPIGKGVDATAFDPGTGLVFSSNGEGTLTVIHEDSPDKYTVVETVPTQRGARTMALDPKTHHVYLAAAEYGETPPATADRPHPRPPMLPDSFVILELAR
jgi:DNA-binding beta-propeller fold protein YncE